MEDFVAGSLSALTCRFVISPIDVVKIRIQLDTSLNPSILSCIRNLIRSEGILGFWKGNLSATYLYMVYGSTQFYSLSVLNDACKKLRQSSADNSADRPLAQILQQGITGGIAATIATSVSYPFDLMRTRYASFQGRNHSMLKVARSIVQNDGFGGFYRGLGASLLQIYPQMFLVFSTHKLALLSLTDSHFYAGALAGFVGKSVTLPVDVLRKRMQIMGSQEYSQYFGHLKYDYLSLQKSGNHYSRVGVIWSALRGIYTVEGVRGLFKGFWPSVIKSALSSAVTFYSFNVYKSLLIH